MPKSRAPSRSQPLTDERDRAGPPPGRAEVEQAIGRILDRLKPKRPKTGGSVAR